jgi:hypothetical protein
VRRLWWRWINAGSHGKRLQVLRFGRSVFTTHRWLLEFCQGGSSEHGIRSRAARDRAIRKAEQELAADGV